MNKAKVLTFIALSVAVNVVGSKVAILLSLPIFLDSIGTILAGAVIGPWGGLLTALVGGLLNGALGDIYSIWFAPSGMLMGLLAGVFLHKKVITKPSIIWRTAAISLPASFVSSLISTYLFSGITTAVITTALVQALSKTVFSLLTSAFLVQSVTDYVDKLIAVIIVYVFVRRVKGDLLS
jgi:energy-coupling factor transport system substrate-specific component